MTAEEFPPRTLQRHNRPGGSRPDHWQDVALLHSSIWRRRKEKGNLGSGERCVALFSAVGHSVHSASAMPARSGDIRAAHPAAFGKPCWLNSSALVISMTDRPRALIRSPAIRPRNRAMSAASR